MRIAICGAGFSGAYVARRLVTEGIARPSELEIFDPGHRTACGQTPCGYGIHLPTFKKACDVCGLNHEDYIFEVCNEVEIGNVRAKADLCTFNKAKFVRDCLNDLTVNPYEFPGGDFDVIIDATARRAVIGKAHHEHITVRTRQVQVRKEIYPVEVMRILPLSEIGVDGVGYYWEFPLRETVHVGCGKVSDIPVRWPHARKELFHKMLCGCRGTIRLSSPKYSEPLVMYIANRKLKGIVVAVGESAGMVSSVTGAGNKESIDGIEILIENWDNWTDYSHSLVNEFKWADKEFEIVKKLVNGKNLGMMDYRAIQKNSKRVGFKLGLKGVISMVKQILGVPDVS